MRLTELLRKKPDGHLQRVDLSTRTQRNLKRLEQLYGFEFEQSVPFWLVRQDGWRGTRTAKTFIVKGKGKEGQNLLYWRYESSHPSAGQTFLYINGKRRRMTSFLKDEDYRDVQNLSEQLTEAGLREKQRLDSLQLEQEPATCEICGNLRFCYFWEDADAYVSGIEKQVCPICLSNWLAVERFKWREEHIDARRAFGIEFYCVNCGTEGLFFLGPQYEAEWYYCPCCGAKLHREDVEIRKFYVKGVTS